MKALSIRQPWAWLILHGGKDVENRRWPTGIRGRILIHAGRMLTREDWSNALAAVQRAGVTLRSFPAANEVPRGGIVGCVDLVDCVSTSTSPWFEGGFGFVLANPRPLPFVPCKGALGFFEAPVTLTTENGEITYA